MFRRSEVESLAEHAAYLRQQIQLLQKQIDDHNNRLDQHDFSSARLHNAASIKLALQELKTQKSDVQSTLSKLMDTLLLALKASTGTFI
jgi:ABC-type protease/lipase transport system fused ATPase/permease subunit